MKTKIITLFIASFLFIVGADAQSFAGFNIKNTPGEAFVWQNGYGWMKFQVGGIANPRIAGYGGKVVFYDNETSSHNNIEARSLFTMSDARLKTNITPINQGLSKVLFLKPVQYKVKKDIELKKDAKFDYGFLAQDVMEVIPEAVEENEMGDLLINYNAIIPFLTQSIIELQEQVDDLRSQLDEKADKDGGATDINAISANGASLEQNIPNPFNSSTTISYTIPEKAISASIAIYTIQGAMVKKYELNTKGNGTLTLQAGDLSAGVYLYSLVVDGKIISTKRMLVN